MPINMQLSKIPSSPGIYIFSTGRGTILYIGKAANLKARLGSYFLKNQSSLKTVSLLKEAKKVAWRVLDSETEALIEESRLIKKHQPKYNILMRDDKQYFYVVFTREKFPRIFLTHQPQKGASFLGPFTDGGAIKSVLKTLRNVFPYCTCKRPHKGLCLNARIGKCLGFCCTLSLSGSTAKYQKNIQSIKKILSGKNKTLLKNFKKKMNTFSHTQHYENAAFLRDKIKSLEKIFAHKEIVRRDYAVDASRALQSLASMLRLKHIQRIEAYDIANIQWKHAYGSMVVFVDGSPRKDLYRIFKIKMLKESNDIEMLKEVMRRRLTHREWQFPDVIVVDGGKGQLNAVSNTLYAISKKRKAYSVKRIAILALTKNKRHRGDHIYISVRNQASDKLMLSLLPPQLQNLLLHINAEAHRFAIRHYRQRHQKVLRLKP